MSGSTAAIAATCQRAASTYADGLPPLQRTRFEHALVAAGPRIAAASDALAQAAAGGPEAVARHACPSGAAGQRTAAAAWERLIGQYRGGNAA